MKSWEALRREFICKNKRYWGKQNIVSDSKIILVEGMLGNCCGINYLVRVSVAAKAVQDACGGKIVVLLEGNDEKTIKLYESFGIHDFIDINTINISWHTKLGMLYKLFRFVLCNKSEGILDISFNETKVGHLIYDDILHDYIKTKGKEDKYTIDKFDLFCLKHIYKYYKYIYIYQSIMNKMDIKTYVATHTVYIKYGIIPFLCVDKGIDVVYTDDFSTEIIQYTEELYPMDRIKKSIKEIINNADKDELLKTAVVKLNGRVKGQSGLSAKMAYMGKEVMDKHRLMQKLGISNDYPMVFIYAHVFRDAPHIAKDMLYKDYYTWLIDTLETVDKIKGVNWILKEHPSGQLIYNEKKTGENIIRNNKYKNIYLCPDEFSTESVKKCADAIITCQGTIGIEASCMGIPVIVCGNPFYSKFGFTIQPKSIKDYHYRLIKIRDIKKLTSKQIEKAQIVFGAYCKCFNQDKALFETDILENIWGYNGKQSIPEVYNLINMRYDNKPYKESELYRKVFAFFKSDSKYKRERENYGNM
jgi:hypothetical protein